MTTTKINANKIMCLGERRVEMEIFELPVDLGDHEIEIETECSLVSAGTETAIYAKTHIDFQSDPIPEWTRYPRPLGYALSGKVRRAGSQAGEFPIGSRVMAMVGHASRVVCDIRKTTIVRIPDNVSNEDAALLRMAGISLVGVRLAEIALGEKVAVVGLGLIGQFGAALSLLSGAERVIGLDFIKERAERAKKNGIDGVVPVEAGLKKSVIEKTGGAMAEVVMEATGNPKAIASALECAARGGRVMLMGSPRGLSTLDCYHHIHASGVAVMGAHEGLASPFATVRDPWTRKKNMETVLAYKSAGRLPTEGLISHTISHREATGIYEKLVASPEAYLGVIIDWKN
ncbi:MAG: zinc-binding alcohol dehydrogenase [Spirochaetia bacterium]|nr:zinc-binding alcohol dehydrogenase [Spirochaetia bacterium]